MKGVHLVVARFDEDVSWLHDVVSALALSHNTWVKVFVYDKGITNIGDSMRNSLQSAPRVSVREARLPNVGRESHTYLEHVLRLREEQWGCDQCAHGTAVTVFLQGRMEDHVPAQHTSISSFVVCMVREASESLFGESSNHACHTKYGDFNAVPWLRVSMYPEVGNIGINLGAWFSSLLRPWDWTDVLQGPTWWQGAVFAIRTCRILSSPGTVKDSYYRLLQAQVAWHVNPETCHYFERSWCFVFPPLDQSVKVEDEATGYVMVGEYAGNTDPVAPKTEDIPCSM